MQVFHIQDTEKAKEQIQKALTVLNNFLKTRTYLVGERITQADIAVACDLLLAYQYVRYLFLFNDCCFVVFF